MAAARCAAMERIYHAGVISLLARSLRRDSGSAGGGARQRRGRSGRGYAIHLSAIRQAPGVPDRGSDPRGSVTRPAALAMRWRSPPPREPPSPTLQIRGAFSHSTRWTRSLSALRMGRLSATRSSNFQQQVRRFTRRAQRDHSMRFRRTEAPGEVVSDIATFFRLHDLRHADASPLSSSSAQAFHADFAATALERGWLRLWSLELDDIPVAAWYGWRLGHSYAFHNGGAAFLEGRTSSICCSVTKATRAGSPSGGPPSVT